MTIISETRVTGKTVRIIETEKVVFDPLNAEHRQAFRLMVLGGKQTEIRFELDGFRDVRSMMIFKMAVMGAGAIDRETARDPRENLAQRAHLYAIQGTGKNVPEVIPTFRTRQH